MKNSREGFYVLVRGGSGCLAFEVKRPLLLY